MAGLVKFTTNEPNFSDFVKRYAHAANLTFKAAFEVQGRELCGRLIALTPPLSGKSIKRGLWTKLPEPTKEVLVAQSEGDMKKAFEKFFPFRHYNAEIESMSAKRVGERRVEKDIKRVIKGVKGAAMPAAENPTVIVSQTNPRYARHDVQIDWGVRQKCQGRDAIRIYADRKGNVYGVDTSKFMPNPSSEMLARVHEAHRGKRGRVTTAGSKDIVTGRWRWLNIVVAPMANVMAYIKKKQAMVGQGKGGWAAGFMKLGGRMSTRGWVGRHARSGTCKASFEGNNVSIQITNNSAWALDGDPDRIIANSLAGRQRDMEKLIAVILTKRWGEGAATFNPITGKTII